MNKPKMPEACQAGDCYYSDRVFRAYEVAAHHAAWEAYVADMAEELDATIEQRDLLSREVLRLERELTSYREAASSAREGERREG